jgi:hypothetical protein
MLEIFIQIGFQSLNPKFVLHVLDKASHFTMTKSISNSALYVISTVKLDEENPMYASLTQENGSGIHN